MHTYAHHCALQIGNQWNKGDLVLVTGGGAHNHYFMETLTRYSEAQFEIPEHTLVNFKEALIFGLLGVLKLLEEVNCYAAVTGAKRDHVAGNILFTKKSNPLFGILINLVSTQHKIKTQTII